MLAAVEEDPDDVGRSDTGAVFLAAVEDSDVDPDTPLSTRSGSDSGSSLAATPPSDGITMTASPLAGSTAVLTRGEKRPGAIHPVVLESLQQQQLTRATAAPDAEILAQLERQRTEWEALEAQRVQQQHDDDATGAHGDPFDTRHLVVRVQPEAFHLSVPWNYEEVFLALPLSKVTTTGNLVLEQELFARHPTQPTYTFWKARVIKLDEEQCKACIEYELGVLPPAWIRWTDPGMWAAARVEVKPGTSQRLLVRNRRESANKEDAAEWRIAFIYNPAPARGSPTTQAIQKYIRGLCLMLVCLSFLAFRKNALKVVIFCSAVMLLTKYLPEAMAKRKASEMARRRAEKEQSNAPGPAHESAGAAACPVCLEESGSAQAYTTPFSCNHRIHGVCASALFARDVQAQCPVCRSARTPVVVVAEQAGGSNPLRTSLAGTHTHTPR